jgi:hypothetical protein
MRRTWRHASNCEGEGDTSVKPVRMLGHPVHMLDQIATGPPMTAGWGADSPV